MPEEVTFNVYYWVNEKSLPTRIASDLTVMQYDASNGNGDYFVTAVSKRGTESEYPKPVTAKCWLGSRTLPRKDDGGVKVNAIPALVRRTAGDLEPASDSALAAAPLLSPSSRGYEHTSRPPVAMRTERQPRSANQDDTAAHVPERELPASPIAVPLTLLTPPNGVTWRSYYYAGSTRVAMRVEGDPDSAKNGVYFATGKVYLNANH